MPEPQVSVSPKRASAHRSHRRSSQVPWLALRGRGVRKRSLPGADKAKYVTALSSWRDRWQLRRGRGRGTYDLHYTAPWSTEGRPYKIKISAKVNLKMKEEGVHACSEYHLSAGVLRESNIHHAPRRWRFSLASWCAHCASLLCLPPLAAAAPTRSTRHVACRHGAQTAKARLARRARQSVSRYAACQHVHFEHGTCCVSARAQRGSYELLAHVGAASPPRLAVHRRCWQRDGLCCLLRGGRMAWRAPPLQGPEGEQRAGRGHETRVCIPVREAFRAKSKHMQGSGSFKLAGSSAAAGPGVAHC